MAFVKNLFDKNFIEYASYVIRDRAIPDLEDGLKPVQRRIMHTLFEVDDGYFQKVSFVVGRTMKYHPHGDAS
ncbi:MAG: DNA topoisomerase IV subunit A, partial [Spirochaetaceae bacterium]|nr:DNA topoisomerase IV subunit A [Spirochaetaceae bacterium]